MITGSFGGKTVRQTQHFIKYWGLQQIKRRIGRRRRRRRKISDLSVLGVELFGNVGLLVHGVRTNKQKNEKQKTNQIYKPEAQERGRRRTRSNWSFHTLSLSPSLLSLTRRLWLLSDAVRKRDGSRGRSWLLFSLAWRFARVRLSLVAEFFNLRHVWRVGSWVEGSTQVSVRFGSVES